MTIHLKPELEALIQADLERGPYKSIDEFVEQAVRMLHDEQKLWAREEQHVTEKIDRAIAQLERGEYFSLEELRARQRDRKTAWLAENRGG